MIKKIVKNIFSFITKISPTLSTKILFIIRTKKNPNLKKPTTFNEKMTFLKLNNYSDNDKVSKCSDKYLVRNYVKEKGLSYILNDLYGVYDNFDDINFEKLPNKFVIKCNHGCAYNIVCKDKNQLDLIIARKRINKWLSEKYGLATAELHYTKISPKIIIEKYLCDKNDVMPMDYKFYCFDGKCKCILVCSEREKDLKLNYFDLDWNEVDYGKLEWRSTKKIIKPTNLEEMIKISEKLAEGFPFVRIDLYNKEGKIIFGEMTFTPACCCAPYYSKHGDEILGTFLNINF